MCTEQDDSSLGACCIKHASDDSPLALSTLGLIKNGCLLLEKELLLIHHFQLRIYSHLDVELYESAIEGTCVSTGDQNFFAAKIILK